jgi:hypothetical protein
MDRINSRIAQAYGYAVCFITVIVILISIKSVVDAAIDLSDPIRAENGGYGRMGRPLSSFEIYKLEARREPNPRGTAPMPVGATQTVRTDSLSDADLRKMYDAEREQVIGNVKFRSIRTLVGSLLLIVVAAILFAIHWRWLRQRDSLSAAP